MELMIYVPINVCIFDKENNKISNKLKKKYKEFQNDPKKFMKIYSVGNIFQWLF